MTTVIEKIEALSRDDVFESALAISAVIAGRSDDRSTAGVPQLELSEDPYKNILEMERLARLVLIYAALSEAYSDLVGKIIEASGKKNFILSGNDILTLAGMGVVALAILTNPRISRTV